MGKMKKWYAFALGCSMAFSVAGVTLMQTQAGASANTTITSQTHGETMVLLNGEVAEFALNYTKKSAINYAPTNGIATNRYVPKPATISWENTRDDALYYTLRVGLEQDLSDADTYVVSDTTADIEYLYSAKHYYYQVYAHYDNDEVVKSRVFDFYTADVPRTVYIEGVTNTRDIGGRYVLGGQYQVKQGMVYRGAEVDRELGAITEEGRRVMLHDLGIKTDLDIRGGDVQNATGTSPIDSSLNYVHLEAPWYTHIKNESYKDALTTEIRTFAYPENYPIYFHCSVGRDRAGTLSAILGALLGVSEVDLFRDYEMTFFSTVGLKDAAQAQGQFLELTGYFQQTLEYIQSKYPADTLMDSAERFVKEYLGITQAEVDSIRNTLWEEAAYPLTEATEGNRATPSRLQATKNNVTTSDFDCTYSVCVKDAPEALYGSSAVNTYTAAEAAAKGIPAGYENEVFEVIPTETNANIGYGALLDFSAKKIPLTMIKSLQFRVYIGVGAANAGTNYPQIRIADSAGNWVHQLNKANTCGEWTTVTVAYNDKFAWISKDGFLHRFELSLRTKEQVPFYVDSIVCELKANDGVAPVIGYTGSDVISIGLGKGLGFSVTANDQQQGEVPVQYIWEEGVALNEQGTPAQTGTYTLTLQAVDYYGNVATKTLRVNVLEEDNVAPEIALDITQVKAKVGAKPMIAIQATDNGGNCTVTKVWSDGALDQRGRLMVGEHTWTITATDAFYNSVTKTITFIVTENEPTYSLVTDETKAYGTFTVTFDGGNPITVPYGLRVDKPLDPVKAEDEAAQYEFIGWYNGDTAWDFKANEVTGNVNLVSKWKEIKQVYTVTFEGVKGTQTVEYGSVIPAECIPETPTKTGTSRKEYVFTGWYLDGVLWNMDTDVVTGNMLLTPQFEERVRLYTITFDGENAQQYEYGSKIVRPEDPQKEGTATIRYEFAGWLYGGREWNFETDLVNYHINLQSQWREVAIEAEQPSSDSQTSDSTGTDSELPTNSSTAQNGDNSSQSVASGFAGCGGVLGGLVSGVTAIGMAAVALLKKKED